MSLAFNAEKLGIPEIVADPSAIANQILVYSKDVGGVTQLFARASDGSVFQITPPISIAFAYRATAISTVLNAATDSVIAVVGPAGAVTITLPAANTMTPGRRCTVKDADGVSVSKPITIAPVGADLIDGQTSAIIALAFGSLDIISDGIASWRII